MQKFAHVNKANKDIVIGLTIVELLGVDITEKMEHIPVGLRVLKSSVYYKPYLIGHLQYIPDMTTVKETKKALPNLLPYPFPQYSDSSSQAQTARLVEDPFMTDHGIQTIPSYKGPD